MPNEYVIRVKLIPDYEKVESGLKEKIGESVSSGLDEGIKNSKVDRNKGNFVSNYMDVFGKMFGDIPIVGNVFNMSNQLLGIWGKSKEMLNVDKNINEGNDGILGMLGKGGSGIGSALEGASGILMPLMAITVIAKGVFDLVKKIVSLFEKASPMFKSMLDIFRRTFEMFIRPIADMFAMVFLPLAMLLYGFVTGIYVAFIDFMKSIGTFKDLGNAMETLFKIGYKIGYVLEKLFLIFAYTIGEGYKGQQNNPLPPIMFGSVVSKIMDAIMNSVVDYIGSGALNDSISKVVVNMFTIMNNVISSGKISNSIKEMLNSIVWVSKNWISNNASKIGDLISGVVDIMDAWIVNNPSKVGKVISDTVDMMNNWIGNNTGKIGNIISNTIDIMVNWINGNTSKIGDVLSNVIGVMKDWITSHGDLLGDLIRTAVETAGQNIAGATNMSVQPSPIYNPSTYSNSVYGNNGLGMNFGASNVTINVNVSQTNASVEDIIERLREELNRGGGI